MDFVRSSICLNLRQDGRKLDQPHELKVVPNISSISHGSSQFTYGDNLVQTTVNFSVSTPDDSSPDEGIIDLTICGATVFENHELSQRNDELLCNSLYDLLFQNNFPDLKSLCILPGRFCWNLRIHCTVTLTHSQNSQVIKRGGSVLDALSMGVVTALRCSEVPEVDVMIRDEMESSGDPSNLQIKLSSEKNQFIDKLIQSLPIVTSVGKVGEKYLWGLTKEEESCCEGILSVAVDPFGRCVSAKVTGSCLHLSAVDTLIRKSSEIAHSHFSKINELLN